jgi:choline-sulfatase
MIGRVALLTIAPGALLLLSCGEAPPPGSRATPVSSAGLPSLLLVTLDTTRADAVAPEAAAAATPNLAALAARGIRFTHAYSTVPTTFPAHASMMSGLYPAGHGVHENGRRIHAQVPLLAERLRDKGYATAAFVSGYPLERQFGLDRGFELYDDEFGSGRNERTATETTDRALAWLASPSEPSEPSNRPRFLWVHYYDPHEPYLPPEPFRSRFPADPYLGEVAYMDSQLGRLVEDFERSAHQGEFRALVVGDHGEGLGEHGEALHGNLLYQGVMRVPLLMAGSNIPPAVRQDAVSIRQVRATLLQWAGDSIAGSLLAVTEEPVLAEAMQPFLNYRWQPQVMAVDGRRKLIRSGRLELYDLAADPGETLDLAGSVAPDRALARAVADYPLPVGGSPPVPAASGIGAKGASGGIGASPAIAPLADEERKRLASLGYIASDGAPTAVPAHAPRAAAMTHLFGELDSASRAFANADYGAAARHFRRILRDDPGNLMAAVRLAVAESFLGDDRAALDGFALARRIDPESIEVRHYLAMHHLKEGRRELAEPLFDQVLAAQPDRLAALEGLARIRATQGRLPEAAALFERAVALSGSPGPLLAELGRTRMAMGDTPAAIAAFERARRTQAAEFRHDLELGVLYLAANRTAEAGEALDRVPPSHPGYPMALFKRAQASVLLAEPDRGDRIRAALEHADATTRPLILRERLFAAELAAR